MKKILLLIILFVICNVSFAQSNNSNADYRNAIIRYLKVSRSINSFNNVMKEFFTSIKKVNNTIPEKMWDIMTNEFSNLSDDDYADYFGELYKGRLTAAELNEISDFYETPTGAKYALAVEKTAMEKDEATKKFAEKIIKRVMDKLDEE